MTSKYVIELQFMFKLILIRHAIHNQANFQLSDNWMVTAGWHTTAQWSRSSRKGKKFPRYILKWWKKKACNKFSASQESLLQFEILWGVLTGLQLLPQDSGLPQILSISHMLDPMAALDMIEHTMLT